MMTNRFIQQRLEYFVMWDEGKFVDTINIYNEGRDENGDGVNVHSIEMKNGNKFDQDYHNTRWSCAKDIIVRIVNKSKDLKMEITFKVSFSYYYEKVLFPNSIADFRHYQFFRLIVVDKFNDAYVKEIPILDFHNPNEYVRSALIFLSEINSSMRIKINFVQEIKYHTLPVVYTPQASGYFIHEVIGHLFEQDTFNSYGRALLEKCNINQSLSVIDAPEEYNSIGRIGSVDDLGNKMVPITLIENGRIQDILSEKNGAMRSESIKKKVMPRMRCTYIKPVEDLSWNQIVSDYKTCVLMTHAYSGSCDVGEGEYRIYGHGQLYEKGEMSGVLGNVMIKGAIHEHLSQIDHIGNDLKIYPSECSKLGNVVRVGMGGPSISFKHAYMEGKLYR